MRRLIIEGITGVGKSTMYKKLVEELGVSFGNNLLALDEYLTWRIFENQQNIEKFSKETFDSIINFVSWVTTEYCNAELQNTSKGRDEELCCIIEGFHWNAYVRGALSKEVFYEIENRLHKMGFEMILLTLSDDKIRERSVNETRKYRTPGWSKYLETLGNSDDEISFKFKERQDKFYQVYEQSSLDKIQIRTDEKKWNEYVTTIVMRRENK